MDCVVKKWILLHAQVTEVPKFLVSIQLFNYPPYLIIHPPPLLEGPGAEGAEKILGYFDLILVDFLNKIDDFESKIAKIFAPAARFSWNVHFWGLKWGKITPKSSKMPQNPSKIFGSEADLIIHPRAPPLVRRGLDNKGGVEL